MRWIPTLVSILSIAVLAFSATMPQADPELPPSARLLPGHLQRTMDGKITVQAAARPQLRVCPKPFGRDCQFTDLAAAAAAAEPGSEIVLAPGLYEQGA